MLVVPVAVASADWRQWMQLAESNVNDPKERNIQWYIMSVASCDDFALEKKSFPIPQSFMFNAQGKRLADFADRYVLLSNCCDNKDGVEELNV